MVLLNPEDRCGMLRLPTLLRFVVCSYPKSTIPPARVSHCWRLWGYSWVRGRSANIQALRGLPPAPGIPSPIPSLPNSHLPITILLCITILLLLIGTIRMPPQATSLTFALSPTQFWAYCKCPTIGRSDLMPLDPMSDKCP